MGAGLCACFTGTEGCCRCSCLTCARNQFGDASIVRWIGAPAVCSRAGTFIARSSLERSTPVCAQVRWIGAPLAYCVVLSVAVGVYHNLADVS